MPPPRHQDGWPEGVSLSRGIALATETFMAYAEPCTGLGSRALNSAFCTQRATLRSCASANSKLFQEFGSASPIVLSASPRAIRRRKELVWVPVPTTIHFDPFSTPTSSAKNEAHVYMEGAAVRIEKEVA
jgi:hypothetical protein